MNYKSRKQKGLEKEWNGLWTIQLPLIEWPKNTELLLKGAH